MEVMLGQYGTDDMAWLMEQSDKPDTVKVERIVEVGERFETKVYYLPAARFDNRQDKTSFVRKPQAQWKPEEIKPLHEGLAGALQTIRKVRSGL